MSGKSHKPSMSKGKPMPKPADKKMDKAWPPKKK